MFFCLFYLPPALSLGWGLGVGIGVLWNFWPITVMIQWQQGRGTQLKDIPNGMIFLFCTWICIFFWWIKYGSGKNLFIWVLDSAGILLLVARSMLICIRCFFWNILYFCYSDCALICQHLLLMMTVLYLSGRRIERFLSITASFTHIHKLFQDLETCNC